MHKNEVIRLVGCQGSIQFLTAAHVLSLASCGHAANTSLCKNILLVYDLYAPKNQERAFFKFIEKMATEGPVPFYAIHYVDAAEVSRLHEDFQRHGLDHASATVKSIIGVDRVDEIYLSTNWQPTNKLLINCFSHSTRICYGDSIGLHIPEHYFSPLSRRARLARVPALQPLAAVIKQLVRMIKRPAHVCALKEVSFTKGYYITTALAKEKPPWPASITDREEFKNTLRQYAHVSPSITQFGKREQENKLAVLLTSNFFEAGRMSYENEIAGYVEFVEEKLAKGSSLLIKPHPRDGIEKLKKLSATLTAHGYHVVLLDDLNFYFLPFELFLFRLGENVAQEIHCFTFSTACLSIKLLFGTQPIMGLGEGLVKKYFYPDHQRPRMRHEEDLKRLISSVA